MFRELYTFAFEVPPTINSNTELTYTPCITLNVIESCSGFTVFILVMTGADLNISFINVIYTATLVFIPNYLNINRTSERWKSFQKGIFKQGKDEIYSLSG